MQTQSKRIEPRAYDVAHSKQLPKHNSSKNNFIMKLKHEASLAQPSSLINSSSLSDQSAAVITLNTVSCLAISPNLLKLAAVFSSANHIVLYDLAANEERDKFALKSSAKSAVSAVDKNARKSFTVTGIDFSADSERLAIGQSDCVIYVYRIGQGWKEKKSIVNRFNLSSPVAALRWLPLGILFATVDGRVKMISGTTNKMSALLNSSNSSSSSQPQVVVSMSSTAEHLVLGLYSGKLLLNSTTGRESTGRELLNAHSVPPFALAITSTRFVAVGGSDGRILFLELNAAALESSSSGNATSMMSSAATSSRAASRAMSSMSTTGSGSGGGSSSGALITARQTIEWGADLAAAIASPSGSVVFFSSRDSLLSFELEGRTWKHKMTINLAGALLISGLCWSADGTKLVTSSLNGAVDLFRCRWRSKLLGGGRFEVNYVGPRAIAITDLQESAGGTSMFTAGQDIVDVKLFKATFVVIWTSSTLIMASLLDPRATRSEIEWHGLTTAGVRFSFDYENVVLISAVGELFLVELGADKILGSVRTDFVSPHLLSVRINERKCSAKVFAYLLDVKTISAVDLTTGLQLCTWSHSERIDWMELNETGKRLIYRDKALKLVLLNLVNQEFTVLLPAYCGFVQWVPASDVVVAQCKEKLYIWYDFARPEVVTLGGGEFNEAREIERLDGRTTVKMSVPGTDVVLDEILLEFDTAIDDGDLERAEAFLESLSESSNGSSSVADTTNSMWLLLGNIALKNLNLSIGERAFAAIGDVAKVALIRQCQQETGSPLMALLSAEPDWARFEAGPASFEEVLGTYIKTHNWERAIAYARRFGGEALVEDVQGQYYNWLLETGQHSLAASILERSGKVEEALALYLKSGRLYAVTRMILENWDGTSTKNGSLNGGGENGGGAKVINAETIRRVIEQLLAREAFEEAADLLQLPPIDDKRAALENYVAGAAYSKAITLARKHFPAEVVGLENQYGEHLLHEAADPANAVNHFIEAGKTERALEAAISARQFDRAAEIAAILDHLPPALGKKIAEHYAAKDELESALEMYLAAGAVREAVTLLNGRGQYARAYKLAAKLMEPTEAKEMYEYIARGYAEEGKLKEAEKIYIACGDVDAAISMWKGARQFEAMLRLVKQYHPGLLTETSVYLAKELEADRLWKQAETYYVAVGEWRAAALMYRNADQWEDAYRVSRAHGGAVAAKQVAYHWAVTMANPGEAVALLNRYGLLNQVVDYAIETGSFDFALSLITASGSELKHKLIDVRLKYALHLETEGRLHEAEAMFIEANKPKEAVVMYLHANAFDEALRVAEEVVEDEEVVKDVLTANARFLFERERARSGGSDKLNSSSLSMTLSKVESLLLRAGRIEVAIRLYKDVGLWNEAVRVCEQYAPQLTDSLKREMIAEARDINAEVYFGDEGGRSIRQRDDSGGGRSKRSSSIIQESLHEPVAPQVDLYAALKVAEQNDDKEAIVRYAILLATQLLKERLTLDSLRMLQRHDAVFLLADSKKLLSRIAVIILSELEDFTWSGEGGEGFGGGESGGQRTSVYAALRDCFCTLLTTNSSLNVIERSLFEKYLLISHYLTEKAILEAMIREQEGNAGSGGGKGGNSNFRELHLKISVSLLRYTDVIRADKAFYEAGMAARGANRPEMAFVFLNHFLDLLDAIEEHDLNVDHSDFVGTDIPYEVPLPSAPYYDQEVVEGVKSWILQMSMDTELSQSLPMDPLREGEVYEASLINADGSQCLPCLVTGYPVIRHKAIEFKAGKYAANKEDWNRLLMLAKMSESSGDGESSGGGGGGSDQQLKAVLHFVGRLCGNATIVKFSFQ